MAWTPPMGRQGRAQKQRLRLGSKGDGMPPSPATREKRAAALSDGVGWLQRMGGENGHRGDGNFRFRGMAPRSRESRGLDPTLTWSVFDLEAR